MRAEEALRPWRAGAIEHIGSTAVPGLQAKPIIDMAAQVAHGDTGELVGAPAAIG